MLNINNENLFWFSYIIDDKNWLWYLNFGHLINFGSLKLIGATKIVFKLPLIDISNEVCEKYMLEKKKYKEHFLQKKIMENYDSLKLIHSYIYICLEKSC